MNVIYCGLEKWILIIKDIVLTCAAVIAGYVGIKGLDAWRQQLKGNNEYKLAKQLLRYVYELREAISIVRHPFIQYPQEPDMPKEKLNGLSEEEKRWHSMAQAYQKRWEPVPKAKSALDAALLEVEIVWGRSVVEKITPLNELIGELLWAIEDYLEAMNPNVEHENTEPGERKKRRETMYARGSAGKDEYRKRLEAAIAVIEKELKPHIEQYHR